MKYLQYFWLLSSFAIPAAILHAQNTDALYLETSAGVIIGHFDAYHGGSPTTRSEHSLSGFSPAIKIGYRLTPHLAVEGEFAYYGKYAFDNIYATFSGTSSYLQPGGQPPIDVYDYVRISYNESLWAGATRLAYFFSPIKRLVISIAPGIEYQGLRQTEAIRAAWSTIFSLPEVVPDPKTSSFHFWRPDFDLECTYNLTRIFSADAGYRIIESPDKTLSRLSLGLKLNW